MKYINEEKVKKIKLNKKNMFIILDFDKTITSFESQDSWDVCGNLLENKFKEKLENYYKYYGKIEIDYSISIQEKEKYMVEWYDKCMNLYYEYNLTKDKLLKSVNESKIIFRKGTKEFLKMANENKIPLIILSAGIGNVIEEFLKLKDCYFENIYIISNFIKFDKNGKMKKFDDNMIHSLNKKIEGHLPKDFQKRIDNKEYGILVGDLIGDLSMAYDKDNILSVGFLNDSNNFELYKNNFDIVLENNDATFDNIEKIIKEEQR